MKLFKHYRYVRNKHISDYIIVAGLLLLLTLKIEISGKVHYIAPVLFTSFNSYNEEEESSIMEYTKKSKKKSHVKKTPPSDLASISKEEFRKLEVRILEKETKLKSYEPIAPDVHFSVQIFASRKKADPEELKNRFNISDDIKVEFVNGWFKYTTGYFIKYWQAREYRKKLVSDNFIYDAFVVAFQFGKRIALNTLVPAEEWQKENLKEIYGKLLPVKAGKYSIRFLKIRNMKIPVDTIKDIYGFSESIYCQKVNGFYHYITGIYETYNDAAKVRNQLKLEGNEDAIVVGDNLLFQDSEDVEYLSDGDF